MPRMQDFTPFKRHGSQAPRRLPDFSANILLTTLQKNDLLSLVRRFLTLIFVVEIIEEKCLILETTTLKKSVLTILCTFIIRWTSSVTLSISLPHFYACPKPGPGFLTYVMAFSLCSVSSVKMRGDCSFYLYWWN